MGRRKKMDKTSKGSVPARSISPDITTITVKKRGKRNKGRAKASNAAAAAAVASTSEGQGQGDIIPNIENKDIFPESSSSSSSLSALGSDANEVGGNTDSVNFLSVPVKKRGRPKKLTSSDATDDVDEEVSQIMKPHFKIKAGTNKSPDQETSNNGTSFQENMDLDVDDTDSSVVKDEIVDEEDEQRSPSPATTLSATPSPIPPHTVDFISEDPSLHVSTSIKEEEKKIYDPNFIPGLDLLSSKSEPEVDPSTTNVPVQFFFEKISKKMSDCSLTSSKSKPTPTPVEPKAEEPSPPSKDDDNSKIRRSSRIKKLETRRGSARRREVVFSDHDSTVSNLSRSASMSSMFDDDSNSSGGTSHFSSVSAASAMDTSSPPEHRDDSAFYGSTSSSPGTSCLSGSLKLKSRWRFSLDAESSKNSDGSEMSSTFPGESKSTSEYKSSRNLVKRPGYIMHDPNDAELIEKLEKFEGIEENNFKTERKISRDRRGMICDCFLTPEDIARGEIGCNEDCLNRLLMIECGSRCPVGDRCTNKKFERKEYCALEVFKTDKKGHGLRTMHALPEGGFVMEYVGEVLDPREFKHRTKEYAKSNHEHFYFMALKSDAIIDATLRGNCSRFINHSCEPNCETQKWTVNGELRIGFFAIRDLDAGEEITFDYQFQRYGKKAQQCFCMTPSCRGWIGGENEDDQKDLDRGRSSETESGGRVKTKAEKKRRKETLLEDMAYEEELAKLEQTGLRNKFHTLTLCRLMVRAEDWDDRERILNILIDGSPPCRRLFLDYHGLRLLWGWMLDLPLPEAEAETQTIRSDFYHILVLKALSSLPIQDKSVLQDSKVLSVIEKWSGAPTSSKFIVRKVKPEISEATSSVSDAVVPDAIPRISDGLTAESKDLETQEPESTTSSTPSTSSEKSPDEPVPTSTTNANAAVVAMDSDSPENEPVKVVAVTDGDGLVEELNWKFVEKAKEVLGSWAGLQEVFRIPKKERVDQMKEHEREADIGDDRLDRESNKHSSRSSESRDRDRDRSLSRSRHGRSSSASSYSKGERSDRNERIRIREREYDRQPNRSHLSHLSKEERRHLFAAEVARAETEERNRRIQEEMICLHQERCARLGLDVTSVPIVDPSCSHYLDPNDVTWKTLNLDDPNLLPELRLIVQTSQYPMPEDNMEFMTPEQEFVFPPWPQGLLPPPPLPPVVLPPSWKMSVDDEGRCYYYHVRTRHTQWYPPSPDSSGVGSDSSDSEEVESGDEDNSEGTLSASEQLLLKAQACVKFNASRITERSEKRKKSGLVQERIISPRGEDDKPFISQKSIRARKVQLMEQKIQEAKREAESLAASKASRPHDGNEASSSSPTMQHPPNLDSTISPETMKGDKETNEGLTSLSQKSRRQLRDPSSKTGTTTSKRQLLLDSEESATDAAADAESESLDSNFPTTAEATSINQTTTEEETGNGDGDLSLTEPLGEDEAESSLIDRVVRSPAVVIPNSSRVVGESSKSAARLAQRLSKISERKKAHKRSSGGKKGSSSGGRKRGGVLDTHEFTAEDGLATKGEKEKKVKGPNVDDFRSQIANVVVQYLNPYRKPGCKAGHIATTEDFKHLARKMTHTIMLKELKHARAGKALVVTDGVKQKMKEFVKKYMAKYGERSYARSPDESSHSQLMQS